jgi:putative oxidoreductase
MERKLFISQSNSLILLRVSIAAIFLAHSTVRIANSTVGQFGEFLENKGFAFGVVWVWGITVFEIIGGLLLAFGYFTKILAAGFIFLLVVGIVLIHAELGWFVGEHGTGGSEYSFILIMALIVIAASEKKSSEY